MTQFIPHNPFVITDNCLTDGQYQCTYAELPALITTMTQHLAAHQVTPDVPVIFGCENTLPHAILLLALLEANYSFLLMPQAALAQNDLPSFCAVLLSCADATPATTPLSAIETTLQIQANPQWQAQAKAAPIANEAVLWLRTSGSTGAPKLVMHTHQHLRENAQHCVERLGLTHSDRVAIPVPLFHMYGLGAGFLPSVLAGAAINIQKGANLLRYMQHEREFNPNIAFMTPVFCENLRKGRRSPRPYKFTVVAGDRLRQDSFHNYQAFFGPLVQLYGSTEMGALAAGNLTLSDEIRQHTAGWPMPDVEIRLAIDNNTNSAQTGQPLWCKRACGFSAYVDLQGQLLPSSETFDADNWFFTKDLAIYHPEGYLEQTGRTDNCVNRDGLLVAFSEVEMAIERQTAIEQVIVLSKGESQRGKKLIAFCTLVAQSGLTVEEIQQHCYNHLPARAVPDEIQIITQFPLLPNGKVDRQALMQFA